MRHTSWISRFILAATLAGACAMPAMAAEDATMHEVYTAAQAGRYAEAQGMMDKVLRDHPNSAKAHFVEAELMARQGQIADAKAELATAERLAPGLPFAKPSAVSQLQQRLNSGGNSRAVNRSENPVRYAPAPAPAAAASSFPTGLILGGVLLAAFIFFAVRYMNRRAGTAMMPGTPYRGAMPSAAGPYGNSMAQAPMQGPGQAPGYGNMAGGGAAGSGLMGSLATGAALGAGLVAGQALMHHFTDSNGNRVSNNDQPYNDPVPQNTGSSNNDMGGNDFGVSDSGSWDDNSGGGGGGGDSSDDWS